MLSQLAFLIGISLFTISCASNKETSDGATFGESSVAYLDEFQASCSADQKRIWGLSLCVPMVILDQKTMKAVASQSDPKGSFTKAGKYFSGNYSGPKVYANTSLQWDNQTWSMVLWPLPQAKLDRIELMNHEAFHSIQDKLNLPGESSFIEHLDQYEGRLLIRLEWQALLSALKNPEYRTKHLKNALAFRKLRFKRYKSAHAKERSLDFNEGLAAYTGAVVRLQHDKNRLEYLDNLLVRVPELTSLARSSSYYAGPLYGLLLDESKYNWKNHLQESKGFGELITKAYRIQKVPTITLPKGGYTNYDFQSINVFEKSRAKDNKKKISNYLQKINSPNSVILKPTPGSPRMFDPNGILVISEGDFIYTFYQTTDRWGTLRVEDGVRVTNSPHTQIFLGKPQEINSSWVKGDGWTIELAKKWTLKKAPDGHYRPIKK